MNIKQIIFTCLLIPTLIGACTYSPASQGNSTPLIAASTELSSVPVLAKNQEPAPKEAIATQPVITQTQPVIPPANASTPTETVVVPDSTILNPLTGLPVNDPSLLSFAPALVSVSNFPISVRPQSGLSFAPHVYEMTIGEGMTRFLAVYYGNYGSVETENVNLGAIRSGRLPYEQIRNMYDGFIIMAGAAPEVTTVLAATHFREKVNFSTIKDLAEDRMNRKGAPEFGKLTFDLQSPEGGVQGDLLNITWSYLNRVRWTYDPNSGKYLREQDKSDGSGKLYPALEKLTGEQLAFDNVVVLAAEHEWQTPTRIEMNLLYVIKEPAVFFRDGKAYPVFWTSLSPLGPIRFMNSDGSPFAYKPGNTWYEVIESIQEIEQIDDESWSVRFINP